MANSPDLSPFDYVVNRISKEQCRRKEAHDLNELVATADRVWKKVGLGDIQRALRSLPSRMRKMIEAAGYQIENILYYKMFCFGCKKKLLKIVTT